MGRPNVGQITNNTNIQHIHQRVKCFIVDNFLLVVVGNNNISVDYFYKTLFYIKKNL